MKRLTYLLTTVFLLSALCFGVNPAAEDSSGWDKLKEMKTVAYVKVYDDPHKTGDPGKAKRYILDMTYIRELLEKAGIAETVILELYTRFKGKKIVKLGKYEPKIETIEGESVVKFSSIPGEKRIYIALEDIIRRTARRDIIDESRFWLPNPASMVVKNAKKKIKAWVKIQFLYTSR